ncbi:hypothetical protein TeGR_g14971 [Tetraparma gracilis]|uniref:Uncharacterized protein n=1 Tax=Tetraparma gracilis TaxID=2962635 RepID=A0ABQ6M7K2_9STRA|nr:hypothetical protein TeGR_g14971 [Tetraparma gracilis]
MSTSPLSRELRLEAASLGCQFLASTFWLISVLFFGTGGFDAPTWCEFLAAFSWTVGNCVSAYSLSKKLESGEGGKGAAGGRGKGGGAEEKEFALEV